MSRQTRAQLRKLNALTEAQAALGWGVILVLAALLGTIYVSQASRIASVGRRVQLLQNELEDLKRQNAEREQVIAESQALDRLQQEAIRLGFIPSKPGDVEYIIVPDYPVDAESLDPLAPTPEAAVLRPPPPTMRAAIWLYLSDEISDFMKGEAGER